MKTICSISPLNPSKIGFFLAVLTFSLMLGCKKAPQHIHNGPEYHRVNQSLTVPIEVKQSHDSDSSQKLTLSPGLGSGGSGPKLNLNFPGKSSSSQSVTNTTSNKMKNSFNRSDNTEELPPKYTE